MSSSPESVRPTLIVKTSPSQSVDSDVVDDTPKTGSSILAWPRVVKRDGVSSPVGEFQWGLDDEVSPLQQPVSSVEDESNANASYGPPGLPGSFEYKRWFNAILLHDLEACISQIQQYAKRGLRQGYGDEIDSEIIKRRDVTCECLQAIRYDIKKVIQLTKRHQVSPTTVHCFETSSEAQIEEEVEVWMNMKSNLNVEMFCCYDEVMRTACGTWKMGGKEEAQAEVGVDWMACCDFAKLLEEYEQLIMR